LQQLENYREKYYVKYYVNKNEKERKLDILSSPSPRLDKSGSKYGGKLGNISQLKKQ